MEIGIQLEAIHAIDLFFDKPRPILSSEVLHVELRGAITDKIIQSWELKEPAIARGWNRLYCDVQSHPLIERTRLVIRFKDDALSVALAAGAPQFYNHEQSLSSKKQVIPFAIRVIAGIVGTPLPRPGLTQACEYKPASGQTPEDGAALLQLIMPLQPESFAGQICWRSDLRGFLLHPSGGSPVIGVLENLQAVNVKRMTARFRLEHPGAQVTEFAFWAEPVTPAAKTARAWSRKLKNVVFKVGEMNGVKIRAFAPGLEIVKSDVKNEVQWIPLYADQRGQIVFDFPQPYSGFLNLFFATKNGGARNDYSWAVFDDLDIEYSKI
jgi:hypothetical protein